MGRGWSAWVVIGSAVAYLAGCAGVEADDPDLSSAQPQAAVFAFAVPELEEHLLAVGRYGAVTLHGELGIAGIWLAAPLSALFIWLAWRLPG